MINKINNNWIEILIRLLFDVFFVLLVLFVVTLLGEALIPGIITNKIGWRYLIGFLILNLGLISYLSQKFRIFLGDKIWINKKNIPFLGIFLFFIFVGSFWRGSVTSFLIAGLATLVVLGFLKMLEK